MTSPITPKFGAIYFRIAQRDINSKPVPFPGEESEDMDRKPCPWLQYDTKRPGSLHQPQAVSKKTVEEDNEGAIELSLEQVAFRRGVNNYAPHWQIDIKLTNKDQPDADIFRKALEEDHYQSDPTRSRIWIFERKIPKAFEYLSTWLNLTHTNVTTMTKLKLD